MRKTRVFVLLFLLSFQIWGCKEKSGISKPNPFIQSDSMVVVLTDIQLLEALKNYRGNGQYQIFPDSNLRSYYQEIMMKHNLTEKQFKDNYRYYQYQLPAELDAVYDSVNVRLNQLLLGKTH